MQYIVRVSGDVSDKRVKSYIVNTDSEESARTIAANNFCEEFSAQGEILYANTKARTKNAYLAFVFMIIPILLSYINWKHGHDTISIAPDYISCFFSAVIYAAYVIRFKGISRTVGSWIDIVFCLLSWLLLSTFIKTLLVTETISIFGLTELTINANTILIIAMLLSWLGLKLVSLFSIVLLAIFAFSNISALNDAMGSICGPLYIISSFLGLLLYLSVEPAVDQIMLNLRQSATQGIQNFKVDIAQAKEQAINAKSAIHSKINSSRENKE